MSDTHPLPCCTPCSVREVAFLLADTACPHCGAAAKRVGRAQRTAVDLDLARPVLLLVQVSVHRCQGCRCYFRAQPPFLRKDVCYTERVVRTAVAAVHEDGMAFRSVSRRMARDFWVRPSEASIRRWSKAVLSTLALDEHYQEWVVSEFSGILCVDEVYQGQLALLVAVDPAAPLGDRLIGYQLVQEPVDSGIVDAFLQRLAGMGLRPDQVVTDGSTLYPRVLARVWPQAAHQLCLFHETRRLTRAAMAVISQVRTTVPPAPHPSPAHLGWPGPLRAVPPSDDPHDPAVQRWHLRRQRRAEGMALVQALAARGLSARAICRQTGLARHTVRRWLTSVPDAPSLRPDPAPALSVHARPRRQRQTPALLAQIRALAAAGLTHVAIAQRCGVHRVTVATWLKHAVPAALPADGVQGEAPTTARDDQRVLPDPATAADPPPPWRDWEEVRQVREALKAHRFLLLRQPKTLTDAQAEQVALLLHSPVGAALGVARRFLLDWWLIWRDAEGTKRMLPEAQAGYQLWQTDPAFAAVPALARVQSQVTQTQFTRLSQFLRHPQWEATNNGAERAGRAFRHRQQPHFNLRGVASIEGSLRLVCQQQRQSVLAPPSPGARSARGRPINGLPRAA